MPLTDYQKRYELEQSGFNPDLYDIDEANDRIIKKKLESPAVTNTPVSPLTTTFNEPLESPDSPLKTFGKSAAMSAFPSIMAGAGAGLATGALSGSAVPGWGTLIGGIGGALAGGYAGSKIQQAVLPDDLLANVSQSQEQNPISGILGGLSTMPLGGMNPSFSNLRNAGVGLGKLATGLARTPAESTQMLNVGLGAGIGGALPVAESLATTGQMPDIKDIVLQTLAGAAFNKPNAIGRKFGFHSPEIPKELPNVEELLQGDNQQPTLSTMPKLTPDQISSTGGLPLSRQSIRSGPLKTVPERSDAMAGYKENKLPSSDELSRMTDEGGLSTIPKEEELNALLQEKKDAEHRRNLEVERLNKAEADRQSKLLEVERAKVEVETADLENQMKSGQMTPNTVKGVNPQRDFTKRVETTNKEVAAESAEDLANRKLEGMGQDKYQDEPQVSTKFAEEVNLGIKDKDVPTKPTSQWTELFKRFGISKRNTEVSEDGSIINTLTGKPVAGQTTTFKDALSKTLVKVNPDKAGIDTAPHELAHAFIDQLRNSKNPNDKNLILKFEKTVSKSPEYQALSKEKGWTPEEFIATEQGLEYLRRNLNLSNESALKTQWKDLWSHIKTKYGKDGSATNEDYRRLLQYKFQYDAPFHEYHKTGISVGGKSLIVTSNQDSSEVKSNTLETDIESYRDLDNKRNKMINDGSAFNSDKSNFTPEFKNLWQTLEDIKNRHGGMPPSSKGERVVNQNESSILTNLKKTLASREYFKNAESTDKIPKAFAGDYFKGEIRARPNKPDVVLHESIHKFIDKNRVEYLDNFTDKLNSKEITKDDLSKLASTLQSYGYKANAKKINDFINENNRYVPGELTANQVEHFLSPGIEEALAQASDDNFTKTGQGSRENILNILNKVFPEDFVDFLVSRKTTMDEYYPKFDKESNKYYQDDSSILSKQPGEGKTPYPFKLKELEKGTDFNEKMTDAAKQANEYSKEAKYHASDREQRDKLETMENASEAFLNPEKNQDEPAIKLERQSFLPIFTARIDKITEKLKSPTSKYVADNLHRFSKEQDILTGNIGNKLIQAGENYSPEEIQRTYRHAHQMSIDGKSNITLTGREKKLYEARLKIIRDVRDLQNKMGLKVKNGEEFRAGGIDPDGYMFSEVDPIVAHTWAEKPSSVESKNYDKAYVNHLTRHGLSNKEAVEALKEYKTALGNNVNQDIEFGALRKAQGAGLPWELVDKNFNSAAIRYGKRAGKDLAYFKYIQSDPKMLKALSLKDQYGKLVSDEEHPDIEYIGSAQETKDALRSVFGIDRPRNLTTMAAARAVSNLVMGVGTSARNILNMPAFVGQYVQVKQLPLVAKAIANLGETKARAFENNAVKASFQDFDAAGYYEGSPNPAIRLMNRFSELARKYQGRNLSDKFEGEFYYSLGEQLAVDNIARAKTGDKEAKRFIERFGTITDKPAELLKRKITQDDISRIAKSFVDAARGTYSEQGLPSIAIEGEFAPFFALSRFAIEKSNTIWKDVILPAKQGIYGPLIRYTLGSIGVGLLIEKLNEELSNKKGAEPTINEVLAAGDEGDLVAKAISTLQLASFAGIISDGAKFSSNLIQGKSTKFNNPLSFPLYTLATETIAGNISDATQAIKEGEDPFEILGQLAVAISTQSVQSLRYIENHINPEETKRKEKFRYYNIWQELTDRKSAETSGMKSNPFANKAAKEYKKETDIGKAVEMLPKLIGKAIEKSAGNPDKLKSELTKIKNNSYQIMPSPESIPLSFLEYIQYLKDTKGEEEANKTLVDYLTTNEVNKIKSSLIPSL